MKKLTFPLLLTCLFASLLWASEPDEVLDEFHAAAALADMQAYFALMTEEIVFLGTDGSERWQGDEFRDFVRPRFEAGNGWEYRPSGRHVLYSADQATAWFDETLTHGELGQCRGSGVLVREGGQWKIAQYNLSVPIPNEIVDSVVQQIDAGASETGPVSAAPVEAAQVEQAEEQARCRKKRHKTNTVAGC